MWPPVPVSRISRLSAAPVIGPSRSPTRPTSMVGSQCRPKMRLTSSSAPRPIRREAPPGMTSSAGWNSRRTRPVSSPAACTSARASPAPSRPVVWTSWPHAWATPGTWLATGRRWCRRPGSASRSARSATSGPDVAQVGDQAGVPGARDPPADRVEVVADQVGGAGLVPGQLGVGVQVASEVEEVVGVLVDHRLDQGERSVRGHVPTRLVHRFARALIRLAVVRREDAVGGGPGRAARRGAPAPAPRRAPGVPVPERRSRCSSSSRTSAQAKSSCWWARFSASPSAPSRSRCASTSRPHVVDALAGEPGAGHDSGRRARGRAPSAALRPARGRPPGPRSAGRRRPC